MNGIKPLKQKKNKTYKPYVFGFTSNIIVKTYKLSRTGKQSHPEQPKQTYILYSLVLSFDPNGHETKKPSDSSDLQTPAASDGTCYSPSLPRQSSARAHTSNSPSSSLTAVSFTSRRSAGEWRFRDNNGCVVGVGPGQQ